MGIVIYFIFSFFISVLLPMYLVHTKHKYAKFWFNILPMMLAIGAAQFTCTTIWGEYYGGFQELATYSAVFVLTTLLTVGLIHLLYYLLYGQVLDLGEDAEASQ